MCHKWSRIDRYRQCVLDCALQSWWLTQHVYMKPRHHILPKTAHIAKDKDIFTPIAKDVLKHIVTYCHVLSRINIYCRSRQDSTEEPQTCTKSQSHTNTYKTTHMNQKTHTRTKSHTRTNAQKKTRMCHTHSLARALSHTLSCLLSFARADTYSCLLSLARTDTHSHVLSLAGADTHSHWLSLTDTECIVHSYCEHHARVAHTLHTLSRA